MHVVRGQSYLRLKQYEHAVEDLDMAVELGRFLHPLYRTTTTPSGLKLLILVHACMRPSATHTSACGLQLLILVHEALSY